MTAKSYAPNELPLLGSNQDSPDPESVTSPRLAGLPVTEPVGIVKLPGRNAPEAPTISHTTAQCDLCPSPARPGLPLCTSCLRETLELGTY